MGESRNVNAASGKGGVPQKNDREIPWRVYLTIGCVGLILTAILAYGFFITERMDKMDIPSLDAVSVAQLETIRANHQIESIAKGRSYDNIESALAHLDVALYHLQQLNAGGDGSSPPIHPIEDKILQDEIDVAKQKFSDLKAVAWQWLAARGEQGEMGASARYFDHFNAFMNQIAVIRSRIIVIKALHFNKLRAAQLVLFFICITLTTIVGVVFHRYERRSSADFIAQKNYERRLKELLAEIRNFAVIVSHDMRAPLVNLKGFVREIDLLLEKIKPEMKLLASSLPKIQREEIFQIIETDVPEALDFITGSATRMETMIQALLRLSRLETQQLNIESINLDNLLKELLETFAYQITRLQVRVLLEPLPEILADRFAVEQIFSNLIGNAIQYLSVDRTGEVKIGAEKHLNEMIFYVRDNGIGISSADLTRIFDIFQRVGTSTTPGEGVGLTYTRALVRRHGGRIWCESRFGEETTFFFTIPIHIEEK
jgi:signal transduction histidine kinase